MIVLGRRHIAERPWSWPRPEIYSLSLEVRVEWREKRLNATKEYQDTRRKDWGKQRAERRGGCVLVQT